MANWKKTPITEANLCDYLLGCSYQEWQDITKPEAVSLIKKEMDASDCDLTDDQIYEVIIEWVEEEEESAECEDDWKRERAMLAGMAFGTRGYNEVMGYEVQEFSCFSCGDRGCYRCE